MQDQQPGIDHTDYEITFNIEKSLPETSVFYKKSLLTHENPTQPIVSPKISAKIDG